MSLRFIDSVDHYASGDLTEKYHSNNGVVVQAGAGRRGTAALYINSGLQWVSLTLEAQARWIVGFALRYEGHVGAIDSPAVILDLGASGVRQVALMITNEGFLRLTRGSNGTTLGQSLQALHTNVYYYIETFVFVDAAGEAIVRVDGVEWLHVSGIDTQETTGVLPTQVRFGSTGVYGLLSLTFDDVYICDGQGSGTFTTFLGDCRVDALRPNADGTYTAWTPSSGGAHYPTVDEPTPNDDTDYVSTTTGGTRDSYQLQPLPTMPNPEVLAVQACISARKEDVDEILIKPLLVSGGITSVASTVHELNASYRYALDLWTVDPNGGGVWTEAAVNSLQVGMERP